MSKWTISNYFIKITLTEFGISVQNDNDKLIIIYLIPKLRQNLKSHSPPQSTPATQPRKMVISPDRDPPPPIDTVDTGLVTPFPHPPGGQTGQTGQSQGPSTSTSSPISRSPHTPSNSSSITPGGGGDPPPGAAADTVLATAGYDHTIKLWQVGTALCLKTFQHPDSQVNDLKISPDRRSVAAAGFQHVRLYDVQGSAQSPAVNFEGLSKNVTCIGFNRDGQWMFSGGEDFNARIWDLRSNSTQKVFQTHSSPITCATLHPNNTELIIGDFSGTIHLWNLRNDKTEQLIPDQSNSVPIQDVCIDQSGKLLAAVNNKGDCYIWTLEGADGEELRLSPLQKMRVHKRYALSCVFSPDSSLLATTSADQTCKVWKMSDFSLQAELHCSGQRWVWSAAFTGDSQFVITASSDNLARLWSLESCRTEREYNGHQKPVTCVAFRDPSMVY